MDAKTHPDIKELLENLNKIKPTNIEERSAPLRAPSLTSANIGGRIKGKLTRAELEGRGGPI
jgi:hypothetical protein